MSDLNAKLVADLREKLAIAEARYQWKVDEMRDVASRHTDSLCAIQRQLNEALCANTDLKRELAEARAEIEQQRKLTEDAKDELRAQCVPLLRRELEQQRTRAEAAEQELREERMRADDLLLVVKHCHASSTHAAAMRGLNAAVGAVLDNAGKLAAIRAHLAGVDVNRSFPAVYRGNEGYVTLGVVEACALIAAAREAMEP